MPAALSTVNPNSLNVKPVLVPARLETQPSVTYTDGSPKRAPRTRPIIISVEAAIGTGKSTLLRLLQNRLGGGDKWVMVQEPVEQWQKIGGCHNLLEAYYANQERFAFSFQTNCVLSRIRGLQDVLRNVSQATEVIVLERCWASDRNTFGEMLRRSKKISELEWALYSEWFDFAVENAPFIDGHVYLEASTTTCMSRLRRRDRTEECGVTEAYQRDLIDCHETWLQSLPEQERVCRIAADTEYVYNEEATQAVVDQIAAFIESLAALRTPEPQPNADQE